jgi:hypothetical protein
MSDEGIQPKRPNPGDTGIQLPRLTAGRFREEDTNSEAAELRDVRRRRPSMEYEDLPQLGDLGSLAQLARKKRLRQARTTLLVLGILIAIVQTIMWVEQVALLKKQIQKQVQEGGPAAEMKVAETHGLNYLMLIHGAAVAVAVVFILLAFFVKKFPISATATALVLFLGWQLVLVMIDPVNLVRALVLNVIVIVALVKAVQVSLAARRDRRLAEAECRA